MDAIVQETEQDSELAAAYQVSYINRQGEKKYLFLSLSALLSKLRSIVRTFKCEGDCLNLSIRVHNAQRLIADLQHLQNSWVSTSMLDIWQENMLGHGTGFVDKRMLIDRPLMIYLSLMEERRSHVCVFPHIPCSSCMIERGFLARIHKPTIVVSMKLATPGCADAELSWGRRCRETPQEPSAVSKKQNEEKRKSAPLLRVRPVHHAEIPVTIKSGTDTVSESRKSPFLIYKHANTTTSEARGTKLWKDDVGDQERLRVLPFEFHSLSGLDFIPHILFPSGLLEALQVLENRLSDTRALVLPASRRKGNFTRRVKEISTIV